MRNNYSVFQIDSQFQTLNKLHTELIIIIRRRRKHILNDQKVVETLNRIKLPKAIVAAVTDNRKRRTGTVVQSLREVAGSSELAIVAAPAPALKAKAVNASFDLAPKIDRATTMFVHRRKQTWVWWWWAILLGTRFKNSSWVVGPLSWMIQVHVTSGSTLQINY